MWALFGCTVVVKRFINKKKLLCHAITLTPVIFFTNVLLLNQNLNNFLRFYVVEIKISQPQQPPESPPRQIMQFPAKKNFKKIYLLYCMSIYLLTCLTCLVFLFSFLLHLQ